METSRREKLAEQIRASHPEVQVRMSWMSCDFEMTGIEIFARDARMGETLDATLTDAEIATMPDAAICTWADTTIAQYASRRAKNARARAVREQIDRDN